MSGAAEMLPAREAFRRALSQRHGEAFQKKLEESTIAVCGLGGLGSNIAMALARAGTGRLLLVDFDRVDLTNLNRQQYKASQIGRYKTEAMAENLREIMPYIDLRLHSLRLTADLVPQLLQPADIICEAFDGAEDKAMLTDAVLEHLPDKYLIAASGMAGLDSANSIRTRRITKRFYLCGDGISDVSERGSLFAPRVMACAAHQAQTALRILAGEYDV